MHITFISDTHGQHTKLNAHLPGGDILFHTGDFITGADYFSNIRELRKFCEWFESLDNYTHKIFIAGNHDRIFESDPFDTSTILKDFANITYLQDSAVNIKVNDETVKIYGSPWQPEFYNWAFNLPRNGEALKFKWDSIPSDTDILLTHSPAYGILDTVTGRETDHLGCELLAERIKQLNLKLHAHGHIHTGYGITKVSNTFHINAAVLDESYQYTQYPTSVCWDSKTNNLTR
jgi:Icc-related predicted phosphoesterase